MASLNRSTLNQLYPSIKRYCWTRMRKFVEVTRESAPTSGCGKPTMSGRSSHMNLIWQQLKRCHGRTLSLYPSGRHSCFWSSHAANELQEVPLCSLELAGGSSSHLFGERGAQNKPSEGCCVGAPEAAVSGLTKPETAGFVERSGANRAFNSVPLNSTFIPSNSPTV